MTATMFKCPTCGARATSIGSVSRHAGGPEAFGLGEHLYTSSSDGSHTWKIYPSGKVEVVEIPPSPPIPPRVPIPVFDEWSSLNQIICDWRARFDVLREELPKCKTKAEAKNWIDAEGFGQRYPILPESLPH